MDMAGHLGGSRAGSFSLEGAPLMGAQDHSDTHLNLPEDSSLITLARRNTKRNRSIRNKKAMDFQDIISSRRPSCDSTGDQALLRPGSFINHHRRSPSHHRQNSPSYQRSPSPRRRYPHHLHHDIGFSDTVSNVVEIVKHEHQRASQRHRFPRGSWSASTSPTRSPSPSGGRHHTRFGAFNFTRKVDYGTTSLCQRSRSPSPTNSSLPHHHGPPFIGIPMQKSAAHQGNVQHSNPTLGGRKGQGRRLPPTPCKPSTLQLRPGSINFPKLNASPTHQHFQSQSAHVTPHNHPHTFPLDREPLREISPSENVNVNVNVNVNNVSMNPGIRDANQTPLSFEQAVAMGRGGRVLPSPVPNGYKPKPTGSGHSESDEDDWC